MVKKAGCNNSCFIGGRIRDYNAHTSLHGPKYITEEGRHFLEKIFWSFVVTSAAILGAYLTLRILVKWQSSPIITSIDSTNYPLSQIVFPAVTICPSYKGIKEKLVSEICKRGWGPEIKSTEDLNRFLETAIDPLLGIYWTTFGGNLSNVGKIAGLNTSETVALLRRISPSCSDYLLRCSWDSQLLNCSEIFRVQSTDDGFCCSFNVIPQKDILSDIGNAEMVSKFNEENGLEDDFTWTTYAGICPQSPLNQPDTNWPGICKDYLTNAQNGSSTNKATFESKSYILRNATGPGTYNGLSIVVDTLACGWLSTSSFDGIKVYVHNPDSFPEVGQRGMLLKTATTNFIALKSYVTQTTSASKAYSNLTRNCNFQGERILQYYSTYSRTNCEIEVQVNAFYQGCGCKPYYYPGNYPLCNSTGMECITKISGLASEGCLPSCFETTYEYSVSSANFPGQPNGSRAQEIRAELSRNLTDDYFENNLVMFHVFFESSSVVSYKRDELYAIEDMISNIGGVLGLCMGFSLVSVVELIFFFTVRAAVDTRRK